MNELKDYILILEDIIPHTLCNDILNEYINSSEWQAAVVGFNRKINKEIRNCSSLEMSSNIIIEKNKNVRKSLDDKVFECAKEAIKEYNKKFNQAMISKDSGYDLLKYEKGGFYTQHIDSFSEISRTISCSFILNNDFKGGEFSFFNNKLVYPLKKGAAIMFPSNFLYPHSVLPVIQGTRYSIITWFI
jgi:predicted 2-oxoglutarate/Fe(II)-dependent dioxygenase YbiX